MRVAWVIVLLEEVDAWYRELCDQDEETAALVAAAINLLEEDGPNLARPLADRIEGSKLHNLKELRPGSTGTSEVRILFIFDPQRQAVLLVAGDQWSKWYAQSIPIAETRYERWLAGEYNDEIGE
jgi:hypothetical protein